MNPRSVAHVVELAGGEIVGRVRLQKITCLLEMAGAQFGFHFDYHLYGPYSDALSVAVSDAGALGLVNIEDRTAQWGGHYSIFRTPDHAEATKPLARLATLAAAGGSVELELAVTAAFLAKAGVANPWAEVASRKSGKATDERVQSAKDLYARLSAIQTPTPLPRI